MKWRNDYLGYLRSPWPILRISTFVISRHLITTEGRTRVTEIYKCQIGTVLKKMLYTDMSYKTLYTYMFLSLFTSHCEIITYMNKASSVKGWKLRRPPYFNNAQRKKIGDYYYLFFFIIWIMRFPFILITTACSLVLFPYGLHSWS